ncbi:integrase core domain-containing protein [Gilliamella apicola]|uniref:integrase core domain-containing protein n=1 Tax=Gilliamella sp. Bif1-4 TaxID=3120233 RepID=UPI0009BD08AA
MAILNDLIVPIVLIVLDLYLFNNLAQARRIIEEWLTIYNTERPHEALNNMTPIEYKIGSLILYVSCVLSLGYLHNSSHHTTKNRDHFN